MSATTLRVAVVGTGPAGMYATERILELTPDCAIDLFERLPCPWGLVRRGVAPDHPEKKLVIDRNFEVSLRDPRVALFAGVNVGVDVTTAELASWYDAVIYATGASGDRQLGIPGEELPGCFPAQAFIGWCNGDPDAANAEFDLDCERAVVVGNGNVALDVARLLKARTAVLERTDIAMRALDALRSSRVREVVVLGRRGPAEAAFHNPELEELEYLEGVTVRIEGADLRDEPVRSDHGADVLRKIRMLRRLQERPALPGDKQITLRFHTAPVALDGAERVEAVQLARTDGSGVRSRLVAGLVIRAIGYRSGQVCGLPYDPVGAIIPNRHGRVFDGANPLSGVYVAGWAKRGCRGMIGSNKRCAQDTVDALLDDRRAGRLPAGTANAETIRATLAARGINIITKTGWHAIDRAEREAGRMHGRPRIKFDCLQDMLALAREG
jgi:ferredoxin/flavodoxin---NADP+ reductase